MVLAERLQHRRREPAHRVPALPSVQRRDDALHFEPGVCQRAAHFELAANARGSPRSTSLPTRYSTPPPVGSRSSPDLAPDQVVVVNPDPGSEERHPIGGRTLLNLA